jgi:hypothetical protein
MENPFPVNLVGKKKLVRLSNKVIAVVVMLSLLSLCLKIDSESFMISMNNFQFNMLLIVHSIIKDVMEDIPS